MRGGVERQGGQGMPKDRRAGVRETKAGEGGEGGKGKRAGEECTHHFDSQSRTRLTGKDFEVKDQLFMLQRMPTYEQMCAFHFQKDTVEHFTISTESGGCEKDATRPWEYGRTTMLWKSTISFTDDELSRTPGDIQLPAVGEGTEEKQLEWHASSHFCCRRSTWPTKPRPSIDDHRFERFTQERQASRDRRRTTSEMFFFCTTFSQIRDASRISVPGQLPSAEVFFIPVNCQGKSVEPGAVGYMPVYMQMNRCQGGKSSRLCRRTGSFPVVTVTNLFANRSTLNSCNFVVSWRIELKFVALESWRVSFFNNVSFVAKRWGLKNHPRSLLPPSSFNRTLAPRLDVALFVQDQALIRAFLFSASCSYNSRTD